MERAGSESRGTEGSGKVYLNATNFGGKPYLGAKAFIRKLLFEMTVKSRNIYLFQLLILVKGWLEKKIDVIVDRIC